MHYRLFKNSITNILNNIITMQKESGFKREIRLFDAIMIVAGTMIGSGIFIVSADIARSVGSSGYLLLIWLITGFITIAGAVSYGELAGMMPKAGGQYVYLREAYGKLIAFLYAWTLFLVIQTGTIAAVAVAFARYTGVLIPDIISEKIILLQLGNFKISSVQLLAIASIVLLTYINSNGIKNGKIIQNIFGSTKLLALFGLIIFGLLFGVNPEVAKQNFSELWNASTVSISEGGMPQITSLIGWAIIPAIGVAMVGSLFSSDAWNNIGFSGDEIVNPKRNLVLSMVIGTALVTLLYILINIVYLLILPLHGDPNGTDVMSRGIQYATNDRVAAAVAEAVGGSHATILIAILIMISTFGCNNGCILSGARVYYATAKDGLFFPSMGKLNSKGVPGMALVFQVIWASVLCLSGSYGNLLDYVIFAVLLFYILTIAGIFILRKKQPHAERPYKAFGYPVIPALYILLASAVCIILLIYKPNYSWPGFIIVGLGVPVYYLFKKSFSKE
jgi:basic amino acid/polyamine antiporter, APA family